MRWPLRCRATEAGERYADTPRTASRPDGRVTQAAPARTPRHTEPPTASASRRAATRTRDTPAASRPPFPATDGRAPTTRPRLALRAVVSGGHGRIKVAARVRRGRGPVIPRGGHHAGEGNNRRSEACERTPEETVTLWQGFRVLAGREKLSVERKPINARRTGRVRCDQHRSGPCDVPAHGTKQPLSAARPVCELLVSDRVLQPISLTPMPHDVQRQVRNQS